MHRFVPTLETCQLLKEAGMPQEGGEFYWVEALSGKWLLTKYEFREPYWDKFPPVRAPLTDESGKFIISSGLNLPIWDYSAKQFVFRKPKNIHISKAITGITELVWLGDNEAEARGQLILELHKEGVGLW